MIEWERLSFNYEGYYYNCDIADPDDIPYVDFSINDAFRKSKTEIALIGKLTAQVMYVDQYDEYSETSGFGYDLAWPTTEDDDYTVYVFNEVTETLTKWKDGNDVIAIVTDSIATNNPSSLWEFHSIAAVWITCSDGNIWTHFTYRLSPIPLTTYRMYGSATVQLPAVNTAFLKFESLDNGHYMFGSFISTSGSFAEGFAIQCYAHVGVVDKITKVIFDFSFYCPYDSGVLTLPWASGLTWTIAPPPNNLYPCSCTHLNFNTQQMNIWHSKLEKTTCETSTWQVIPENGTIPQHSSLASGNYFICGTNFSSPAGHCFSITSKYWGGPNTELVPICEYDRPNLAITLKIVDLSLNEYAEVEHTSSGGGWTPAYATASYDYAEKYIWTKGYFYKLDGMSRIEEDLFFADSSFSPSSGWENPHQSLIDDGWSFSEGSICIVQPAGFVLGSYYTDYDDSNEVSKTFLGPDDIFVSSIENNSPLQDYDKCFIVGDRLIALGGNYLFSLAKLPSYKIKPSSLTITSDSIHIGGQIHDKFLPGVYLISGEANLGAAYANISLPDTTTTSGDYTATVEVYAQAIVPSGISYVKGFNYTDALVHGTINPYGALLMNNEAIMNVTYDLPSEIKSASAEVSLDYAYLCATDGRIYRMPETTYSGTLISGATLSGEWNLWDTNAGAVSTSMLGTEYFFLAANKAINNERRGILTSTWEAANDGLPSAIILDLEDDYYEDR